MKRFVLTLLTAGISAVAGLQASGYGSCNSCCDPCCDPCPSWCCGSFEVGGQWIYLRPTSCDYDFVIKDNRPFDQSQTAGGTASVDAFTAALPNGKSHGIDPDYESGFRVSVGYIMDCSCYDVRVEYTYHHPTDHSQVFGTETNCGLWPTYMHPRYARNVNLVNGADTFDGFETPLFSSDQVIVGAATMAEFVQAVARSNVKLDYDSVDLQFGSRSMRSCNLWMRTYAGLHFMNLDHRQEAQYNGAFFGTNTNAANQVLVGAFNTHVRWNKNTWGVGPLFGIDARYDVACGFGIGGHFGAAILAGETDGKMVETDVRQFPNANAPVDFSANDVNEPLDVRHDHRNILFPYLRASLGVNYLWCCGDCFRVLVEVGYEFNSYINSIGHFRFNDGRGTGMANCYSYNLDGIYVSVRATI